MSLVQSEFASTRRIEIFRAKAVDFRKPSWRNALRLRCQVDRLGHPSQKQIRDARLPGAIDAWNKAIEADPDNGATKRANIADASIWIDDYKTAVERYGALYKGDPENSRYRYGYGRALVFDGDYSNALDILRGVTNDDGGSSGQSRVFEESLGSGFHRRVVWQLIKGNI